MAEKILGLDIGTYSIKAALFEATFSTFELTDLFESPPLKMDDIAPENRTSLIMDALNRMIQDNSFNPKVVVTAIPGSSCSTRIIQLPLAETQLPKVLPFEMESYLPFSLDELILDYHPIDMSKTSSKVLAAAVQKSIVGAHLAGLHQANIEPAFVTLDSAALYNIAQFTPSITSGSYAIVDLGHTKTSICIVSEGKLVFVRSMLLGGFHFAQEIRQRLDLTWEQANEVLRKHGVVEVPNHPLRSEDLKHLSMAIRTVLDPLTQQIQQSLGAFLSQQNTDSTVIAIPRKIEHLYLCGGGAGLTNLDSYFSNYLGIPTTPLELFKNYPDIASRLNKRSGTFGQAIALGLRAAARGSAAKKIAHINFRKEEFSFAKDISDLKENMLFVCKWAALVFVVALAAQVIRIVNLSVEKSKAEAIVVKEYKRIVPEDKKPPKTAQAAIKTIQAKVAAFAQKQEVLTAGLSDTTALGVLLKISNLIPEDISIDTQELAIDRNKITLRGLTSSFENVDRIVLALQQDPKLSNLEKGDIKDTSDGKKSFTITIVAEQKDEPKGNQKNKKGGKQ